MTFAEKLRTLMDERNWTAEKTAEMSHLKVTAIRSYLVKGRGRRLPTLRSAIALTEAFGLSVAVFEECEDLRIGDDEKTTT